MALPLTHNNIKHKKRHGEHSTSTALKAVQDVQGSDVLYESSGDTAQHGLQQLCPPGVGSLHFYTGSVNATSINISIMVWTGATQQQQVLSATHIPTTDPSDKSTPVVPKVKIKHQNIHTAFGVEFNLSLAVPPSCCKDKLGAMYQTLSPEPVARIFQELVQVSHDHLLGFLFPLQNLFG